MNDAAPTKTEIKLTDEQESATGMVEAWIDDHLEQEFRLGGFAGTGKTTVIRELTSRLDMRCAVASFTGKAVAVLRSKGVKAAQTLHRLMYDPIPGTSPPQFEKKKDLSFDLVVVDEASMVSEQLYADLKSFGIRILFVGDPGQLEPVGDDPYLMARPDVVLSTIHRQALGSPILKFAEKVRKGKMPWMVGSVDRTDGIEGRLELCEPPRFWKLVADADQVICGFNRTRHELNSQLRAEKAFHMEALNVGERLICLRNNRWLGIFNGMILIVKRIIGESNGSYIVHVDDEYGNEIKFLNIWKGQLGSDPMTEHEIRNHVPKMTALCDYGYAITAHKSQGSEWDTVAVFEEIWEEKWEPARWRYTAATRAAVNLVYCRQ